MSNDQRRWFAGVDWASEKHDVVVTDSDGKTLGRTKVEHSGEGLARMADWLVATTGATPEQIHVGIESRVPWWRSLGSLPEAITSPPASPEEAAWLASRQHPDHG